MDVWQCVRRRSGAYGASRHKPHSSDDESSSDADTKPGKHGKKAGKPKEAVTELDLKHGCVFTAQGCVSCALNMFGWLSGCLSMCVRCDC